MCIFQIQVVLRISWLLLLSQTALVTPHPLLLQAMLKEGLDCLFCTAFHTVSNYTLPMHCTVDGKNYEVLNWQVNQFNSSSNVINFKEPSQQTRTVLLRDFHLNGHTLGFHPDSKVRTILCNIRNSTTGKYCLVAFI